jgi:hypothetical protein
MRYLLQIVFTLVLLLAPARAQEPALTPQQLTAFNNVQEEYTRCHAYFQTLIACASPAMKSEAELRIKPTAKVFGDTAVAIGRKIGMTQDAMEQRLRRVFNDQKELTNNNVCLNLDSLMARLAARCKELGEHPEKLLGDYMRR